MLIYSKTITKFQLRQIESKREEDMRGGDTKVFLLIDLEI